MATYLFSENRELKNIQDGDVVVNDCESRLAFYYKLRNYAAVFDFKIDFKFNSTYTGIEMQTAYFTRIQADTEPQTAPNTPAPMGSN